MRPGSSTQNAPIHHALISTVGALRPSERQLVAAMQKVGYGRFEDIVIQGGELLLDPWPTTIRSIKFGNATPNQSGMESTAYELKKPVAELFAHVRQISDGMIRVLEVRGGLPFSMELTEKAVNSHAASV